MPDTFAAFEAALSAARADQDRLYREAHEVHQAAAAAIDNANQLMLRAAEISARVAHVGSMVASLHGELARLRAERGED